MSRPPRGARPPRVPGYRTDWRVIAIFAGAFLIIILAVVIFVYERRNATSPGAGTATPAPAATASAAVANVPPSISPAASPLPAAPGPATAVATTCPSQCLIRLADTSSVRAALTARGIRPNYADRGQLWAGAGTADIAALQGQGLIPVVMSDSQDTLLLYLVRLPNGAGPDQEALVGQFGQVLDRAGQQFVVRVPKAPPPVAALVGAGIAVTKLPPVPPAVIRDRAGAPALTDVAALVGAVDRARLQTTVQDLQGMSSTDGSGIGTRYYTATGNVMAAEYLYRRFAAEGLDVWYEDFVTDNGLLGVNVVAEIPGGDRSRVYLVMGHYDSMNPDDLGTAPGADDNATGIAAMLEIARGLAGYTLPHPIRFFASDGEEVNFQGARAFGVEANREKIPYAGAYNIDAVGSPARGTQIVLNTSADQVWLEQTLVDLNDQFGLGQDLLVKQNPVIVADDNIMREANIPTVLVARQLYGWSPLHHTPNDVIAEVDFTNIQTAAELVLLGVAKLTID